MSKLQMNEKTFDPYDKYDLPKMDVPKIQINIQNYDLTKEKNIEKDTALTSRTLGLETFNWNDDIGKCNNSKNYIPKLNIQSNKNFTKMKSLGQLNTNNSIKPEESSNNHLLIKSKIYKELSEGAKSIASNSNQSFMGYLDSSIFNCLEIEGPNLNELEIDKIKILHSPSAEKRELKPSLNELKSSSTLFPSLPKFNSFGKKDDKLSPRQESTNSIKLHDTHLESHFSQADKLYRQSSAEEKEKILEEPHIEHGRDITSLTHQFDNQCSFQSSVNYGNPDYNRSYQPSLDPSYRNFNNYIPSTSFKTQTDQAINNKYLQQPQDNNCLFYKQQQYPGNENLQFNPAQGFKNPGIQGYHNQNLTPNPINPLQQHNNSLPGYGQIPQLLNILQSSKEQTGCRILQKHIEESSEFTNFYLYPKVKPYLVEISLDQFGNYLVQRMLERLNQEYICEVSKILLSSFKLVSMSQFGTRVVQKLIDFVENQETKSAIILALKTNLLSLANNSQGNHVISKILTKFTIEDTEPLNDMFLENIENIVKDKYGCCVIQKLIERSNDKYREAIISNLFTNVFRYLMDPFANYVLQLCITYNYRQHNQKILEYVKKNFLYYALEKFSSNVIEKALSFCDSDIRDEIIDIIQQSEEITSKLLLDLYGNYILQKALVFANEKAKEQILTHISKYFHLLDGTTHGPKLKTKLLSCFSYLSALMGIDNTNHLISANPQSKKKLSSKSNKINTNDQSSIGNNYVFHPQAMTGHMPFLPINSNPKQPQFQNSFNYQPNMYHQSPIYYPNMQVPYSNDVKNYQLGYNQMIFNPQNIPQQNNLVYQQYQYPNYEYPMYVGNRPDYYLNTK